jgi:hypothetical protein
VGIKRGRQWSENVGNVGKLFWKPWSNTDCSVREKEEEKEEEEEEEEERRRIRQR